MDVYEAMRSRYSVRLYQDRAVAEDALRRVLEAGILSPSARNRQQRKFVVVRDQAVRNKLAAASEQPFLGKAPVIIAVVGLAPNDRMSCQIPTDPVDCSIAADHMTLAAVAEGLGTCWIGHFDQDTCREILHLPHTAKIVILVPLGYPADKPGEKRRKDFDQVICENRFR